MNKTIWFLVTFDMNKNSIDLTPMESYGDAATAAIRNRRLIRNSGKSNIEFLVRKAEVMLGDEVFEQMR